LRDSLATVEKQRANQQIARKQKMNSAPHFSGRHLLSQLYAVRKLSGNQWRSGISHFIGPN
jgi:hypothetical protein